ncbi:sulfite exporter TauE/SafE family protein [Roseicyclus amphidinii]|uniref:sulfite exporter TauE/SafE family protein n=1 Tax=Roseicyclus amphidinii TaxID=3034232 RepID=UPI0024E07A9E|nr:sulfite exporter TauE/SafE family protein [Roseicyclus sp. Amp-Y-6]
MGDLMVMPEGLSLAAFWALMATSYAASFITAALGIGGGALLLAVMASLVPPAALIPVHGAVQLASNAGRMGMLLSHVHWPALKGFTLGSILGAGLGGLVVVELPPAIIQVSVGLFVIWSVFSKPPKWLSRFPVLTGGISSFLTMFFGATGLFVAGYTKAQNLARHGHVATHAALMTVQHCLKVVVFGVLGFAFGQWLWVVVALSVAGLAGTFSGRLVLGRMSDAGFKRALDILLVLIALRLIWQALTG